MVIASVSQAVHHINLELQRCITSNLSKSLMVVFQHLNTQLTLQMRCLTYFSSLFDWKKIKYDAKYRAHSSIHLHHFWQSLNENKYFSILPSNVYKAVFKCDDFFVFYKVRLGGLQLLFSLLLNLLIILSINCLVYKMLKQKIFSLLSHKTKKSRKSTPLRSWNNRLFAIGASKMM